MDKIKKFWPYILALLVFTVVACIYMSPVLEGKVIATTDGVQARAAVHEGMAYYEATGERTWWTGSMFSGMPNYQIFRFAKFYIRICQSYLSSALPKTLSIAIDKIYTRSSNMHEVQTAICLKQ